jgi:hypothetical protein
VVLTRGNADLACEYPQLDQVAGGVLHMSDVVESEASIAVVQPLD